MLLATPEYVVHPPVGKWMIAAGMWLFGADNPFGWRFSAALTGTLSIFLLALIAQKLFHSLTLGAVAGVLLAVDGHHLVMSRTSLLDIFLMFWILAAFGALLLDRDDGRRRLAVRLGRQAASSPTGRPSALQLTTGPWLGIRWWRLAAAVCLGLAVGTKWSALFFLAGFGLLTVFWDLSARRIAGVHAWISGGILKDGIPAFLSIVPVAAVVYGATWTGWFRSTNAYFRHWAETNPSAEWGWLPDAVRSLAHYHLEAYKFHQSLTADHPYEASPWSWLVMGRPTSFFYESPGKGSPGCDLSNCTTAILSVGNPLIWWSAAVSLGILLFWWAGRRDWRAGAVLAGVAAGYLPWFMYPERTTFFFYAVSFEPFLVLALVYCLGLVLGQRSDPLWRRRSGFYLVALFVCGGRAALSVLLPGLDRRGDPLPGMAPPDVDAFLDLGQDCRGKSADLRADQEWRLGCERSKHRTARGAGPGEQRDRPAAGAAREGSRACPLLPQGPRRLDRCFRAALPRRGHRPGQRPDCRRTDAGRNGGCHVRHPV